MLSIECPLLRQISDASAAESSQGTSSFADLEVFKLLLDPSSILHLFAWS
jgi:hypothetical protein